jgi:hypothetical protein
MNDTDRALLRPAGGCGGDCASSCSCAPRAEAPSRAGTALARLAELFPLPTLLLPSLG